MSLTTDEQVRAIAEWQAAAVKLWPLLSNYVFPPAVIETIYERARGELPDYFAQWASGVAVASQGLLEQLGFDSSWKPSRWKCGAEDSFNKFMPGGVLVRGCGELWTIERGLDEVLTYHPAALVLFARTREEAMFLAEYFFRDPGVGGNSRADQLRGAPFGLRWMVSTKWGVHQLFRH
jgi:hypothetical protein